MQSIAGLVRGPAEKSTVLDTDGQDHVAEVKLVVHGGQHDGAQTVGQLQGHLLGGHCLQCIGQIADIEADFQLLAVAGQIAAVFCGADVVLVRISTS